MSKDTSKLEYPLYPSKLTGVEAVKDSGITNDSNMDRDIQIKIISNTKIYIWSRLYLKQENNDLEIGDEIILKWIPGDEKLTTKFMYWGRKNSIRDSDEDIDITNTSEEDRSVATLMINEGDFANENLKFIRSLFKTSKYYEFQLFKKEELIFINKRTGQNIEYIQCDF